MQKEKLKKNLLDIYRAILTFSIKQKIVFLIFFLFFTISSFGISRTAFDYLSIEVPKTGGTITEGIIGIPRFINPLLEISDVDRDITALIYSGLTRPDGKGGLILDLAKNFQASEDGLTYTFIIKDNARFHDGKPVTSDDVIFTIEQAKDSALKSPKGASWEGVKLKKINEKDNQKYR